jgi:hypothetical protein
VYHFFHKFLLIISLFVFSLKTENIKAQIVLLDQLDLNLDSLKTFKKYSSIQFSLESDRYKNNILNFDYLVDLGWKLKKENWILIQSRIDRTKLSQITAINSGQNTLRYRHYKKDQLNFDFMVGNQWDVTRGLKDRYFSQNCVNYDFIQVDSNSLVITAGIGYENEQWNAQLWDKSGINQAVIKKTFRGILGFKASHETGHWNFSIQSSFQAIPSLKSIRNMSSSTISYQFNDHFGIGLLTDGLYDSNPPVASQKFFYNYQLNLKLLFK